MWTVYLVRCADDTLYCGITNDLPARLAAHEAGKGAKYTRGRGPLAIVATHRCRAKGRALQLEHAIKQLTRAQKLALDAARLAQLSRRQRRDTAGSTRPRATDRRTAR